MSENGHDPQQADQADEALLQTGLPGEEEPQIEIRLADVPQPPKPGLAEELWIRARDGKARAAEELRTVAAQIRQETDTASDQRTTRMAENLENAANYLDSRTLEEIRRDIGRAARRNAGWLSALTFVLGAAVGYFISREL